MCMSNVQAVMTTHTSQHTLRCLPYVYVWQGQSLEPEDQHWRYTWENKTWIRGVEEPYTEEVLGPEWVVLAGIDRQVHAGPLPGEMVWAKQSGDCNWYDATIAAVHRDGRITVDYHDGVQDTARTLHMSTLLHVHGPTCTCSCTCTCYTCTHAHMHMHMHMHMLHVHPHMHI